MAAVPPGVDYVVLYQPRPSGNISDLPNSLSGLLAGAVKRVVASLPARVTGSLALSDWYFTDDASAIAIRQRIAGEQTLTLNAPQ
jgi:hypothetical protein